MLGNCGEMTTCESRTCLLHHFNLWALTSISFFGIYQIIEGEIAFFCLHQTINRIPFINVFMSFLLHISTGGCLFVMVQWCVDCTTGSGMFAPFYFFSSFFARQVIFGLSWHSSKNRCGWEVDILTHAYLQTPAPYPCTYTRWYSVFTHTCSILPTTHTNRCGTCDRKYSVSHIFAQLYCCWVSPGGLYRFMTP